MRCFSRVAMAVGAIAVVSWTPFDKQPHAMAAQALKSWSDVRTPTAWDETTVDLLVPGAGGKTSTVERIKARIITFRTSPPPDAFSAVVVPDPHTGKTAVVPGARFFISDASGMTAVSLIHGQLNVQRSLLEVSTTANPYETAIAAFVGRFTEQQVAEEKKRYSIVYLGGDSGFFLNGSTTMQADLNAFELANGVLRLDLRSQNGRTGSFWIELSTLRVVKTQVSR